jgi:hypothetical protein
MNYFEWAFLLRQTNLFEGQAIFGQRRINNAYTKDLENMNTNFSSICEIL